MLSLNVGNFLSIAQRKMHAFSVAEAMITLLIVSVALAASAPLISRQMKNSATNNLAVNGGVPVGAIMFFEGNCPSGWEDLSGEYAGRYIKIAGNYNICDKSGENADGSCAGASVPAVASNSDGARLQGETIRRISGMFPGQDADVSPAAWGAQASIEAYRTQYVNLIKDMKVLSGAFDFLTFNKVNNNEFILKSNWETYKYPGFAVNMFSKNNNGYISYYDPSLLSMENNSTGGANWYITTFDTANIVPSGNETQPKTVVLKACRKQ